MTNTHFPSQIHLTTESVLKKHEQDTKRNYNRRIINIKHGTFTLMFFPVFGDMVKECKIFHKNVAEGVAIKLLRGMKRKSKIGER